MKQLFKTTIYGLFLLLFLASCSDTESTNRTLSDTDTDTTQKLPANYYGKWVYLHNGEALYLDKSTRLDVEFVPEDENLLKVIDNKSILFLVRSSIANTTVNGKIELIDSNSSSAPGKGPGLGGIGGVGGIKVLLENIVDISIKEEVVTEDDGSFVTKTLPTGTYTLTVDDEGELLQSRVEVKNEQNNIGIYKLTGDNLNNFKAELILNDEYVIANNKVHEAVLRVHNISDKIGYGLSYDINLSDSDFVTGFSDGSVGTTGSVLANDYKDIPVSFSFNTLDTNMRVYSVNVTITDALGNRWIDRFDFNVNRDLIALNIATKSADINGYIKNPLTGEVTKINTSYGRVLLPLLPEDTPYILILSNPSIENETAYSIGINKLPDDFGSFKETSSHEPNGDQSIATKLYADDKSISYLHATDVDYWEIYTQEGIVIDALSKDFSNSDTPQAPQNAPINVTASDGEHNSTIELTWSSVENTLSYEVHQSTAFSGPYAQVAEIFGQSNYAVTNAQLYVSYFYKVKACNAEGCSAFSTINSGYIFVPNIEPVAIAGDDIYANEGQSITLDASSSYDSDGELTYLWTENGTEVSTQKTFTMSTLSSGIHTFALIVEDEAGVTAPDSIKVYVNDIVSITSAMNVSVYENQLNAINIIAVDNDVLTYEITGGTDENSFGINSATGVVTFKTAPNFEEQIKYAFSISVTDGKVAVPQDVEINVLDIKEAVILEDFTANLDENSPAGTSLGSVVVVDDGDGGGVRFTILSTNSDLFEIDEDSGEITLINSNTMDFETKSTYEFEVRAQNATSYSYYDVTINIVDVNEAPKIISANSFSADEASSLVNKFLPSDADGDDLTYTLSGTDASHFNIVNSLNAGELSFKTQYYYHTPVDNDANNVYELNVTVSDGEFEDTKAITVTMTKNKLDGFYDTSFNSSGHKEHALGNYDLDHLKVIVDDSGSLYIQGIGSVVKYDKNFITDISFGTNGLLTTTINVADILVDDSGYLYVYGDDSVNTTQELFIEKYSNSSGLMDRKGMITDDNKYFSFASKIIIKDDNIYALSRREYNGVVRQETIKVERNLALPILSTASYDYGVSTGKYDFTIDESDNLYAAVYGNADHAITKTYFLPTPETSLISTNIRALKIVYENTLLYLLTDQNTIAAIKRDGSLEGTFGVDGFLDINENANDMLVVATRIYVLKVDALEVYNIDGSVDTTFATNGVMSLDHEYTQMTLDKDKYMFLASPTRVAKIR